MGIIHTAKKHIADELYRKLKAQEQSRGMELSYRQETQLKEKAERESKSMNLNQVCLCFQAMIENSNGQGLVPICEPVYSKCINNLSESPTINFSARSKFYIYFSSHFSRIRSYWRAQDLSLEYCRQFCGRPGTVHVRREGGQEEHQSKVLRIGRER